MPYPLRRLNKIIETLRNAKIVVSMECGHIAHCVFSCPERSGLIVLQPPDRFSAVHRGWSECLGIRFGFVVGCSGNAGYYFSVSEILRTIALMLKQIETDCPQLVATPHFFQAPHVRLDTEIINKVWLSLTLRPRHTQSSTYASASCCIF